MTETVLRHAGQDLFHPHYGLGSGGVPTAYSRPRRSELQLQLHRPALEITETGVVFHVHRGTQAVLSALQGRQSSRA